MDSMMAGLTGLCAGLIAGSALCAFYIALGVFSKSAIGLGITNKGVAAAVSCAAGVVLGNVISLFDVRVTIGGVWASVFGLFSGIYVGIFIACLAEVLSTIPVLKNFGIRKTGISVVLAAFAAGKLMGSLVYWLSGRF